MTSPQPEEDVSSFSGEAPALEQLVSYFVASKASLASVTHVWRANEIVASARTSLEKLAVLHAKNGFLSRIVDSQFHFTQLLRQGFAGRADNVHAEFKVVLRVLDEIDSGVKQILDILKTTFTEPSLHAVGERQRCLFDFVDEQGLDHLRTFFRACIDRINDAQNSMASGLDRLDAEIGEIQASLKPTLDLPEDRDLSISASATTFHALENHATEMAELLQSLVRHFDLCITALKHIEGGHEAVSEVPGDLPAGVDIGVSYQTTLPKHISEEEMAEMLKVLETDAAEVDDVVQEIRDHVSEMEFQLEQINNQLQIIETEHVSIKYALKLLCNFGQHVPNYLEESSLFMKRWEEQKGQIQGRMAELEGVQQFYERFLSAYDGLILEIARRRRVKIIVDKLVASTMAELQKFYEEDLKDREAFTQEQGAYLPSDLWPGLMTEPTLYELRPVQNGGAMLPDISREVLERALFRTGRSPKK